MIGMGFVKTWDALAGLRVILGILEAGFFPSCVYLLSTWYTRCKFCSLVDHVVNHRGFDSLTGAIDEVGKRYAWFYLLGCVASAFAGLLAAGVRTPTDCECAQECMANPYITAHANERPSKPQWVSTPLATPILHLKHLQLTRPQLALDLYH